MGVLLMASGTQGTKMLNKIENTGWQFIKIRLISNHDKSKA